jgi:hypothetical protein
MAAPEGKYYVYKLIDPRTDEVFYIGKGCGSRIKQHEREAKQGIKHPKCDVIIAILNAGLEVKHEIVKSFVKEEAAYKYEKRLISKHGLNKLTNLSPGGRISFPCKPSDPELQKTKDWISVASMFYKKITRGDNGRYWFCGSWYAFNSTKLFSVIDDKIAAIAQLYGESFVKKQFKKHKVIIDFVSKVENANASAA